MTKQIYIYPNLKSQYCKIKRKISDSVLWQNLQHKRKINKVKWYIGSEINFHFIRYLWNELCVHVSLILWREDIKRNEFHRDRMKGTFISDSCITCWTRKALRKIHVYRVFLSILQWKTRQRRSFTYDVIDELRRLSLSRSCLALCHKFIYDIAIFHSINGKHVTCDKNATKLFDYTVNTKPPSQLSMTQWLRSDLGRSISVTTAAQLTWLIDLRAHLLHSRNQKDTHLKLVNKLPYRDSGPISNESGEVT